jgi:hypothetical protein
MNRGKVNIELTLVELTLLKRILAELVADQKPGSPAQPSIYSTATSLPSNVQSMSRSALQKLQSKVLAALKVSAE